jgi:hypothetical protein
VLKLFGLIFRRMITYQFTSGSTVIIQVVHTDTEFMANRPDIIIKNRKKKMYTLINVAVQKCHKKGGRKLSKIQQFMYRNTANMQHEMQ